MYNSKRTSKGRGLRGGMHLGLDLQGTVYLLSDV